MALTVTLLPCSLNRGVEDNATVLVVPLLGWGKSE